MYVDTCVNIYDCCFNYAEIKAIQQLVKSLVIRVALIVPLYKICLFQVTIGLIDLEPKFEYRCIPKKSAHAFFKAQVKNTSAYALLAGPTNVFLDNNFIAKVWLNSENYTNNMCKMSESCT